ncbi:hypothetical protein BS47DRAFT_1365786 [Hydnum rufescens UP504]|uniref:Uncharacterized protein n=1 Tax=Hydnum rufescens UP504 TaxID=1448309 RepID=A0A9P6DSK5_9AGAM|nr:hypothetical protein BS47DRAFT_1365786 [Hydnum rufescens UP504]
MVQFVLQDDGETLLGPAVNVPADFSCEGLEALANKQSGQTTHSGAPTRLVVSTSLLQEVLAHPSKAFMPEDALKVYCSLHILVYGAPAGDGSGDTTAHLLDLNMELPSHTLARHKAGCCVWSGRQGNGSWRPVGTMDRCASGIQSLGSLLGDALKGHTMWITSLAWGPIHMYVEIIINFLSRCQRGKLEQ